MVSALTTQQHSSSHPPPPSQKRELLEKEAKRRAKTAKNVSQAGARARLYLAVSAKLEGGALASSLKKAELLCVLHIHYNVPLTQLHANRPPLVAKLEENDASIPLRSSPCCRRRAGGADCRRAGGKRGGGEWR